MKMRIAYLTVLCLLPLAGCPTNHPTKAPAPDMAAAVENMHPVIDGGSPDGSSSASPPDMLFTYDLAWSGCAGTALANSCVEKFFTPFSACFVPEGKCDQGGVTTPHLDWASGAVIQSAPAEGRVSWFMQRAQCMTSYYAPYQSLDTTLQAFCLPGDVACHDINSGKADPNAMLFDPTTSVWTCPGGTQVKASATLTECPVLHELLFPPCQD